MDAPKKEIRIPADHGTYWDVRIVEHGNNLLASDEGKRYRELPPAILDVDSDEFQAFVVEHAAKPIYWEEHFKKPDGFTSVPRRFYDANKGKQAEEQRQQAAKFVPSGDSARSDLNSYIACASAVRTVLQLNLSSHLKMLFQQKIVEGRIPKAAGGTVANITQLKQEFDETPTKSLLEAIFNIFFGSIDRDNSFRATIEYTMMLRLKIWYTPAPLCETSRKASPANGPAHNPKPCTGFILSQANCTINDNSRSKFYKSDKHGISVRKSSKKKPIVEGEKRKYQRIPKGVLVWEKHIHGWLDPEKTEGHDVMQPNAQQVYCFSLFC